MRPWRVLYSLWYPCCPEAEVGVSTREAVPLASLSERGRVLGRWDSSPWRYWLYRGLVVPLPGGGPKGLKTGVQIRALCVSVRGVHGD